MVNETLDINKIAKWYEANKKPFISYMLKRYATLGPDDAEDLYQECIMVLHQNIVSNKLTKLTCSLSTYLIQIGINKANTLLRQCPPHVSEENQLDWERLYHLIGDETSPYQEEVYQIVDRIEQPCREILFSYYYDSFSMTTIADRLGYKDADVVKATKYRCMQKVKNMLHTVVKNNKQKATAR